MAALRSALARTDVQRLGSKVNHMLLTQPQGRNATQMLVKTRTALKQGGTGITAIISFSPSWAPSPFLSFSYSM